MEREFDGKDSLQLINSMIAEARNNVSKGDGDILLFVGYSLVVIALLNAVLLNVLTLPYMSHWVWALMIPVTCIVFWKSAKQDKKALVRTHLDKIITEVWKGFMVAVGLLFVLLSGFAAAMQLHELSFLVTPLILVVVGLAQYVVGIASKFKPFVRGALVFWLGAVLCLIYFFMMKEPSGQYIIFALSVVGGFIIPGHMLNREADKYV